MKAGKTKRSEDISRRSALGILVGASTVLAFGCGDDATSDLDNSTDAGSSGADGGTEAGLDSGLGADGGQCAATPEGEIGPYFADDSDPRFQRSNIVANLDGTSVQTGIPLTLKITVVDTDKGCAPYVGAQVDIWHCNAAGIYSDQAVENTTTETWLRGYQLTDAAGAVSFTTVIPGWYQGRTTHIHLRVRSSYSDASSTSDGSNTTQLFFDQSLVDRLDTTVTPYSAEGKNSTTNAGDHVFSDQTHGANLLTLSGSDTSGYTASATIGLPILASSSTTGNGAPPGGGPGGDGGALGGTRAS